MPSLSKQSLSKQRLLKQSRPRPSKSKLSRPKPLSLSQQSWRTSLRRQSRSRSNEIVPDIVEAVTPEVLVPLPGPRLIEKEAPREKTRREGYASEAERRKAESKKAEPKKAERGADDGTVAEADLPPPAAEAKSAPSGAAGRREAARQPGQVAGKGSIPAAAAHLRYPRSAGPARGGTARSASPSTLPGGSPRRGSPVPPAMPSSIAPRWTWCNEPRPCRHRRRNSRAPALRCRWCSTRSKFHCLRTHPEGSGGDFGVGRLLPGGRRRGTHRAGAPRDGDGGVRRRHSCRISQQPPGLDRFAARQGRWSGGDDRGAIACANSVSTRPRAFAPRKGSRLRSTGRCNTDCLPTEPLSDIAAKSQ